MKPVQRTVRTCTHEHMIIAYSQVGLIRLVARRPWLARLVGARVKLHRWDHTRDTWSRGVPLDSGSRTALFRALRTLEQQCPPA